MKGVILVSNDGWLGRRIMFKHVLRHPDELQDLTSYDSPQKQEQFFRQNKMFNHFGLRVDTQRSGNQQGPPVSGDIDKDEDLLLKMAEQIEPLSIPNKQKTVLGIERSFFLDLFMPMDSNFQFKVMDLTVGCHQFLYYPFLYPEEPNSKASVKRKASITKKERRNAA